MGLHLPVQQLPPKTEVFLEYVLGRARRLMVSSSNQLRLTTLTGLARLVFTEKQGKEQRLAMGLAL